MTDSSFSLKLQESWQHRPWLALIPLSWIFRLLVSLRVSLYRTGLLRKETLPVPVIIVGNIRVGGTGKTPLVIWLVEQLRARGYKPGVVARGYGGQSSEWPRKVVPNSDPRESGDEPVLISQKTGVSIWVGPDRVTAARRLLEEAQCDLVISDDGLQHYRLERDLEILVVDGARGFGNGWSLPAGPLREPLSRVNSVDRVVINGEADVSLGVAGDKMTLEQGSARNLRSGELSDLERFRGQPVHGVAGIGHPGRFFDQLRSAGLELIEHPLADHQPLQKGDLEFDDGHVVLMTEKDAVKYRDWASECHWEVPVEARLEYDLADWIVGRLQANERAERENGR